MSNLSDYLRENGITQLDFASRIRMSQSMVSRLCQGDVIPSLRRAVEIERITGGEVPVSSWLPDAPPLDDSRSTTAPASLGSVVETVNPEGGA